MSLGGEKPDGAKPLRTAGGAGPRRRRKSIEKQKKMNLLEKDQEGGKGGGGNAHASPAKESCQLRPRVFQELPALSGRREPLLVA